MMITVGQKLWYVSSQGNYRRHPTEDLGDEVVVAKVGRKWATLEGGHGRIDMETLWADGGGYSSPGRCYLSRDAYRARVRLNKLWNDFASRIGRVAPPEGITEGDIERVAALLQIPLTTVREDAA